MFRLACSLAAGIFFADTFLYGSEALPWLYAAFGLAVGGAWGCHFLRHRRYSGLFGGCVALAFALLGAVLLQRQQRQTGYDWPVQEKVWRGVVKEVPHWGKKTWQAMVEVEAVCSDTTDRWLPVGRSVRLYWMPDSLQEPLACGDCLCFRARLERPAGNELTGFDYGRYLERKGLAGTGIVYAGNWRKVGQAGRMGLQQRLWRLRDSWLSKLHGEGLEGDALAVVAALTVGEKRELTPELKAAYSAAGASHILALSGMHVGILAALLLAVSYPLRWARGGRLLQSLCVVAALWGFVALSGGSVSAVRAVTLFTLYVVAARFTESRYSGMYGLSLAMFLMLLCRPAWLFDVGFQLSVSAVAFLLLLHPFLWQWTMKTPWGIRQVLRLMGMSVAAQCGTLPFVLYYFGTFPVFFLLTNLLVIPLATVLLWLSVATLAVSSWMPAFRLGVWSLQEVAGGMNALMEGISRWEGSQLTQFYVSGLQSFLLFVALGAAVGWLYVRRPNRLILLLLACVGLAATGVAGRLFPESPSVHLYDGAVCVKQGRDWHRLSDERPIYNVGGCRVAVADDGRWERLECTGERLRLDYLYICRGFRGRLRTLSGLFEVKQVVLDDALSSGQAEHLRRECRESGMTFIDLTGKGSWQIVPWNEK